MCMCRIEMNKKAFIYISNNFLDWKNGHRKVNTTTTDGTNEMKRKTYIRIIQMKKYRQWYRQCRRMCENVWKCAKLQNVLVSMRSHSLIWFSSADKTATYALFVVAMMSLRNVMYPTNGVLELNARVSSLSKRFRSSILLKRLRFRLGYCAFKSFGYC